MYTGAGTPGRHRFGWKAFAIAAGIIALLAVMATSSGLLTKFYSGGKSSASRTMAALANESGGGGDTDPGGGGDPGGTGGGGGGGSGGATPTSRPYDAQVRGLVYDCASTTFNKATRDLSQGKKPDLLKLSTEISGCIQTALDKHPEYKSWGDVAAATNTVLKCVGDSIGVRDALRDGASGAKAAGKAFFGVVLAALQVLGSDDCNQVARDLGIYKEGNYYVAFIQHGSACVVAGVGTTTGLYKDLVDVTSLSRSQILDEVKSWMTSGTSKTWDKIKGLPELEKKVDEFLDKCKKAKAAAGQYARDLERAGNYIMSGAPIQVGPQRTELCPSCRQLKNTILRYLGLEPDEPRYSRGDLLLVRVPAGGWFVTPDPNRTDVVTITGGGGSIQVTRENPKFTLDGVSGRINFGAGTLTATIDLPSGGWQRFNLDNQGRIERTINADGSITVLSTIRAANGSAYNAISTLSSGVVTQTLREVEGRVVIEAVDGRLVQLRYDNGTVETPFYETDGRYAGSRVVFSDGTITYASPKADGKMSFDAIILPDGSTARLFAVVDANGQKTGGIARGANGDTYVLGAKNEILASYHATSFVSGGSVIGEIRCDASRDCYTVGTNGRPLLTVDANGRVFRADKFVDQFGRTRPIEEFDPKKGDVIVMAIPLPDSAYSATNRTIDAPTAESIEAQMRAMFGLNMYMGGGELAGISTSVLDTCKLSTQCNYTTATVTCFGQSVPVQQAASICPQLGQQAAQDYLAKRLHAELAASVDVPDTLEAGKRYRVRVPMRNLSGQQAPSWSGAAFRLVARDPSWGVTEVALPGGNTVIANTTADFVFDIVAPSVPGTYRFQWQMMNGATPFGQSTSPLDVAVVPPQTPAIAAVDAASYAPIAKRGNFVSIFGGQIAQQTLTVDDPNGDCQFELGDRTVDLFRVDGSEWSSACVTFVSPNQVNIRVPQVPKGNYLVVLGDVAGDYVATSPVIWIGD